jgi:peptide/nickel transport system permease protein
MQGDLGRSVTGDRQPAIQLISERLPASLKLAGLALIISLLLGIPLGVLAAVKRGTAIDTAARSFALLGQSVPVFWLGIVLMYFFSVQLGWLPTSGYGDWRYFVLPSISMALFTVAAVTRLVRVSMIDALSSEYIKLARVKGVSETMVIWKHALRNSLIPVLTYMGAFFATMITGAVVIETVFSWPGIGRLAYESIMSRDFPVMQGVVLTMTAIFMVANLIVDIAYAWLDPRIR